LRGLTLFLDYGHLEEAGEHPAGALDTRSAVALMNGADRRGRTVDMAAPWRTSIVSVVVVRGWSTRFSNEWVWETWLALASYTRLHVGRRRRRLELAPLPDETPEAEARPLLVVADGLGNAILIPKKCPKKQSSLFP